MRSIGKLNDAASAATFGDFLYSKGIECQVEDEGDGTQSVWIIEDGQMDAAAEFLNRYRANPGAEEFQDVTRAAKKKRAQDEKEASRKKSVVATEERVMYERNTRVFPPVTASLIVLCAVTALFTQLGGDHRNNIYYYFYPPLIYRGEVWRLVTPIFLHFGITHIVFNMFWLYDLGGMMENRQGKWYFLLFVAVTAILSNWAQYWWGGPYFGGMSGVVYGMFGFVWMRSKYGRDPAFSLAPYAAVTMIGWLFLCMGGMVGDIANAAHLGGLVVGMAWGFATRNRW